MKPTSVSRIGEVREVRWEEKRKVRVGYQRCDFCHKETPEPSDSVLVQKAKEGKDFVWPSDWNPKGWSTIYSVESCGAYSLCICPDCLVDAGKFLRSRERETKTT